MDADKVPISVMLVFGLWLGEKKGAGVVGMRREMENMDVVCV